MRNFQDTVETRKRSFISAFTICMTVPLKQMGCYKITQFEPSIHELKSPSKIRFSYFDKSKSILLKK